MNAIEYQKKVIAELEKRIRNNTCRGTNTGDILFMAKQQLKLSERVHRARVKWLNRDLMPEILTETAPQFLIVEEITNETY